MITTKIKDLAIAILCIIGSGAIIYLTALARDEYPTVHIAIENTTDTSRELKGAVRELRTASQENVEFLREQQRRFEAEKDSTAAYLKGGRLFYETLGNINLVSARIRDEFDPAELSQVIRDTRVSLHAIGRLADNGSSALERAGGATDAATRLIGNLERSDPGGRMGNVLDSSERAIDSFTRTTDAATQSILLVNQRLPGIMGNSDTFMAENAESARQVRFALTRFNKPRTLREKLVSIVTEGFLKSAPVLIRR